jgi:predicted dehydrogenase
MGVETSQETWGLPGSAGRTPLRIGIAGTGFVGAVHAHAARRAGARIVGVAASSSASAKEAALRVGAEHAFPDAEALVAAPDVDVVHICTPNHLHRPLAEAALAAGKHVVCEKPLALGRSDAQRLCRVAEAAGVVATVPFVYRFYPLVREARARVGGAAGDIGPIRLIHGTYLQDWLSTANDDSWRVDASLGGTSRAFADIGSHWCDLVEFVTGDRLAAVCAELVTAVPERVALGPHVHAFEVAAGDDGQRRRVTTEDIAMLLFRTVGGVVGSLVVSQVSPGRKNCLRFEIAAAEATLSFDQERPETLWVGRRTGTELVARDPAQLSAVSSPYAALPPGHPQGYQDCFDAFVADTYRAIQAGSLDAIDGLPGFADGARAVDITDAVLRSATDHRWEAIPGEDERQVTT